ncbi:PHD finger and SET domain protein, putative [Talaromyces stipitatus ATCC 10500]|uniref:PHD finger and SET domain protein, putative n=1 Tax=Talaromyces stipitatus (strain ATCC 10500 / CBS 375.48 / QM 6759 / NRRL 1006) TaxID=441959 RepID=B8M8X7_TALSN|nr:PHD finger and SET domain protein, putative [Talaromyces stipitatus ATCC 10500]EED20640.1 PHD finger and SET domain protein, putative [Talaromyces stipitatus ATCC 10500]
MTDTSLLATTHSTGDSYPVTAPIHSPAPNSAISDSVPLEDEEPYTIKCICAFEDDDECYYHGQEVPDEHFCTDCSPSPLYLDGKRATERQRRLREQNDSGDRKAKRSGSKSHKKKHHKDQELVNGHHRSDSTSRDQLGTIKKPKSSHRPSASVNSVNVPPKLQPDSRKRSGSVATSMSPTKSSSTPQIPLYSHEFLHLYDNDRGYVNMKSNLVVNLHLLGDMGSWVKDPSALLRAGTGRLPQEIFTYADVLDSSEWPQLLLDTNVDKDLEIDGVHPTWKILKTETAVHKDQIVGEVKGKIGELREYCLDPANRWPELRHPQPFVFFHPQLPIYIDAREEGSILRYVRRSCRPNVTLKTYITNEVEYHFCFVANQDIPADSEVTAMWYYDRQFLGDSDQEEARAISMSNLLANFGGCACSAPQSCLLAAVDRRRHPSSKQVNGKRKKAKSKSATSPTSAGRSTTSRAGSEAAVDDDNADNRSTSGSVRGHTRSRDLTPTHPPPEWALQDTELSARDRRKIAAVEKKFEQLEHDQHGQRKKKRGSATSAHPNLPSGKSLKVETTNRLSDDSALASYHRRSRPTSRKASDPIHTVPRSPLSRPSYVDESLQTRPMTIGFSPLSRRLLKRCHEDSAKVQWPIKRQETAGSTGTDTAISPSSVSQGSGVRPPSSHSEDVEMKDSASDTISLKSEVMAKPPLPSTAAHNTLIPGMSPITNRFSGLHVQLPANHFAVPATPTPGAATPGSLQSPSDPFAQPAQTPGGSMTAPSPVKKKMSLGDYLASRGTMTTPTTEKSQAQATTASSPAPPSKPTSSVQSSTPPLSTDGEAWTQPQPVSGRETIKNESSPTDADITMKDAPSKPPLFPPYVSSLGMQDDSKVPPTT